MSVAERNEWGLKQIEAPSVWPVSVADVNAYARIIQNGENAITEDVIKAATLEAQKVTERQLLRCVWRLTLDRFPVTTQTNPLARIVLPMPPVLLDVDDDDYPAPVVKYDDEAGDEQTMDADDYRVIEYEPAVIEPVSSWPATRTGGGAVRIEYAAGYGTEATDVPEDIRFAIKWLATQYGPDRNLTAEVREAFRNLLIAYHHEETFVGVYDGELAAN